MFLLFYFPVKGHLIEQKIDRPKVKFFLAPGSVANMARK